MQGLDIIIFAGIAVFFILKIMGVLGQSSEGEESNDKPRDGNIIDLHQKYQQAKKQAREAKANGIEEADEDDARVNDDAREADARGNDDEGVVIRLSQSASAKSTALQDFNASLQQLEIKPTSKIGKDLKKIVTKDKSFDPLEFLDGAEAAFEMILTAYAQGDTAVLKQLLTKEIYKVFADAVKQREKAEQTLQLTILAIAEINFVAAEIISNKIQLTVQIVSEQNSVTYDADDNIIDGDKKAKETITDIWAFNRPINSTAPNWYLAATGSAEN